MFLFLSNESWYTKKRNFLYYMPWVKYYSKCIHMIKDLGEKKSRASCHLWVSLKSQLFAAQEACRPVLWFSLWRSPWVGQRCRSCGLCDPSSWGTVGREGCEVCNPTPAVNGCDSCHNPGDTGARDDFKNCPDFRITDRKCIPVNVAVLQ